jgi:hypothetical protein
VITYPPTDLGVRELMAYPEAGQFTKTEVIASLHEATAADAVALASLGSAR